MMRYGQSGYVGCSRSVRACEAEAAGEMPLSRAIPAVAREAGITRREAREHLEALGPCAWHHTGKYARETDYYDVDLAVERARFAREDLPRLPADWEAQISQTMTSHETEERCTRRSHMLGLLAAMTGVDADTIRNAYYELEIE